MNNIFTNVPDVDREILLRIPEDKNLSKACQLSTYTQNLCNNYFWRQRFIRKYGIDLDKYNVKDYRKIYKKLAKESNDKVLIWAANKGYLELLKELVERKNRLYLPGQPFFTALRFAIINGHLRTVKYLLEDKTVNISKEDSDLQLAAEFGHLKILKYLIKKGVNIHDNDDLALELAAENGHLNIVKYLVEQNADIHATYDGAFRKAAYNGHLSIVQYLVEKGSNVRVLNDSALIGAAENGHLNVVQYLVEKGANIHAQDDEALLVAAENGHLDVVKYLVQLVAKNEGPEAENEYVNAQLGEIINVAAKNGHLPVVKYLIKKGANWSSIEHPSRKVGQLISKYR